MHKNELVSKTSTSTSFCFNIYSCSSKKYTFAYLKYISSFFFCTHLFKFIKLHFKNKNLQ